MKRDLKKEKFVQCNVTLHDTCIAHATKQYNLEP